jgi:hypothetical protein
LHHNLCAQPPRKPACCLTDAPNSGMCSSPTFAAATTPFPSPPSLPGLPRGRYSVYIRNSTNAFELQDIDAEAPVCLVDCRLRGTAYRCSPSPVLLGSTPPPLGWCAPPLPSGFSGAWLAGMDGGISSFTQARPVGNTQNVQVVPAVALTAPFLCSLNNQILSVAA